jgi:hypothetical protein
MSYYTKFADVEALLTSTTTAATLASTDAVLVTSVSAGKPFQSTPGAIAQMPWTGIQSLTSASTATNILPTGLTVIASSNALSYLLTAPSGAGQFKVITSTSTAVITVVCSGAGLMSSGAAQGSQFIFNSAGAAISGGAAELVSVGTTRWVAFNSGAITVFS